MGIAISICSALLGWSSSVRPVFALTSVVLFAWHSSRCRRKPAHFDHPEYLFELKLDGFRSLAVIQNGRTELISRNGHPFNSFDSLRKSLTLPHDSKTVFDGEIVCLDRRGRPQFNDLLFHRGEPCFFAFDLLMDDGKDLRSERLTDRKHELRRLLSKAPTSRMRYVEHVEQYGTDGCLMNIEPNILFAIHGGCSFRREMMIALITYS
jgi:hypothetical protein